MNGNSWVLGLCDGHDAGACFMENGRVRFAISEERLSRRKRQAGFPRASIEIGMERIGLRPEEIQVVVLADAFGRTPVRLLDSLYRRSDPDRGPLFWSSLLQTNYQYACARNGTLGRLESVPGRYAIRRRLAALGIRPSRFFLVSHHEAHRYAALYGSGFPDPLIVTLDGLGDGLSGSFGILSGGRIRTVDRIPQTKSLGLLYGEVNQLLGFSDGDEGKTLGLAARGRGDSLREDFSRMLSFDNGSLHVNHLLFSPRLRAKLRSMPPQEVAASLQKRMEEVVCRLVRDHLRRTGKKEICCSGGLFANVEINRRIGELPELERFYVFPHMGDGGLCVGAACFGTMKETGQTPNPRITDIFWGPAYSEEEITGTLRSSGLPYTRVSHPAEEASRLLARDQVLGWFQGRMEFGPRALGNRSILFSAANRELGDRVNRMLERSDLMPFCPVTRNREADACYEIKTPSRMDCGRFMTSTFLCRESMWTTCTGGVHVNGTARAQILLQSDNPLLYELLDRYAEVAGRPSLINTSFNRHGDPIVCSPSDAVRTFSRVGLDAMILHHYLLTRH